MAEPTVFPQEPDDLQFERAEPMQSGAEELTCAFCATPLRSVYYEVNGKTACELCYSRVEQVVGSGPGRRGFFRAVLAGGAAAVAGAGLYYGVRALTGYNIGLISIAVGIMVGKAVRWGTGGKGRWGYQVLAVFLTYMAIGSTYLPVFFQEMAKEGKKDETAVHADLTAGKPAPPANDFEKRMSKMRPDVQVLVQVLFGFGFLFAVAAAAPVIVGIKSPLLLLIIGFGLWEAWKITQFRPPTLLGPLEIGARSGRPAVG